ncbi:Ni/Fe-hydrogenase, b-type cytochrome subunit [Malaciobacter molluscorum LMG 25693]|uniref:Ni/Fe-hydrogenase, b-type cytochrome subunit n=1 Tax=Malaciobacter molluscorum LMG 25693 TaxID=870501 RepID=A0A2G1DLB1_9BACT|nr:Ni/Fe-hydrogenase, b-type cytochrome subunit [Malaciobacter molluscorum]AXX92068.1 [Ni-Fe] hydrogenase, cytochrome b subunit [Malaciobacter molluscorum LMG 25693]PHO19298.1 Ni/Fe-hydrogenase, b-type cytochrome subunit [Malaciobacter molluscorum LMG 25693]RXJ96441.1 Ni/Fe-hydrogenase, b-type cytochrome subunit [Malaciobacter molluscorum]
MIKKHYEFSFWLRVTHWIRVIAIIILTASGFYIAYPFIAPSHNGGEPINFLNALMRSWHIIFGFLLISVTIGKFYLFFFDKQSNVERLSFKDFISPTVWIKQIKYYLLVGKHPHGRGVYNPLQFMAYVGVYASIILISLTGLILYVHVYHEGLGGALYSILRPVEAMLGGLAWVRELHHIAMWIFIIFLPIHIYLAIFNSVYGKAGAMDSIFSGYRWIKEKDKK